jgi:hypothetical protein
MSPEQRKDLINALSHGKPDLLSKSVEKAEKNTRIYTSYDSFFMDVYKRAMSINREALPSFEYELRFDSEDKKKLETLINTLNNIQNKRNPDEAPVTENNLKDYII